MSRLSPGEWGRVDRGGKGKKLGNQDVGWEYKVSKNIEEWGKKRILKNGDEIRAEFINEKEKKAGVC